MNSPAVAKLLALVLSLGACADSPSRLAAPMDVRSPDVSRNTADPTHGTVTPHADSVPNAVRTPSTKFEPPASLQVSLSSHLYAGVAEKKAELAKARNTLVQFATHSKRGLAGVQHSLQVLDALAAPTESEFRRRMDELPIKVRRQQGKDESGREGTVVEIWIDGVKFRSIFTPGTRESLGQATEEHANWSAVGGPNIDLMPSETRMTDDEPATQQEIDDGLALLAALESESPSISAAADDDLRYCQTVLNSCWDTEDAQPLETGYSFGGPSAIPNPVYGPCAGATDCGQLVAPVAQAYTVVAGMVVAAAFLFSAPVVTGVAIAAWAFPALTAYIGFADAAYKLHHCIYAT